MNFNLKMLNNVKIQDIPGLRGGDEHQLILLEWPQLVVVAIVVQLVKC